MTISSYQQQLAMLGRVQAGPVAEPTNRRLVPPLNLLYALEHVADGQKHKADHEQPEAKVGKQQVRLDELNDKANHGQQNGDHKCIELGCSESHLSPP